MDQKPSSQAGFSLVSVLIIMGVVLFSMLLISQANIHQRGTQRALKIKQSYGDVNQALINNVVDVFHKNLNGSCPEPTAMFSNTALDGAATFSAVKNISYPDLNLAPQTHKDAVARCKNKYQTPGTGNRYYFCVELQKDPSAPKDSILSAKKAFAEFAVELIDLQTQTPISCAEYSNRKQDINPTTKLPRDGSAGMAVTMAMYWQVQNGRASNAANYTFSQKALSYIANQN